MFAPAAAVDTRHSAFLAVSRGGQREHDDITFSANPGGAGVLAAVAEDFHEQIARAVAHRGAGGEAVHRVNADGMDAPAAPFTRTRRAGYRARLLWNRLRGR